MKIRYWRKFIERLEDMSNVEAIKLCDDLGLKRLSGDRVLRQSRSVYALNDHYVLKIARNLAGRAQNQHEIDVFNSASQKEKRFFAKLDLELSTYRFVIMEKVITFKEDGKGRYKCYDSKSFLFHQKHSERLNSNYFSDLYSPDNMGKRGNQFVALDYGFSGAVLDMYRSTRGGTRWQNKLSIDKYFKLQEV